MTTLQSDYVDFGSAGSSLSGSLIVHGNLSEVLEQYPKATERDLRLGCMIVLKEYMKEERTRRRNGHKNGWQEFYDPRPTWYQWLKFKFLCRWLGHRWSKERTFCKRCGYNSVQLN